MIFFIFLSQELLVGMSSNNLQTLILERACGPANHSTINLLGPELVFLILAHLYIKCE
jgi:hypothetical protein